MAFERLADYLSHRKAQGYLRQRRCQHYEKDNIVCIDGEHYLNFASNDYLGMRHHEGVLQAWTEGLAQYGAGSGASPLVTGHTYAHQALETYLAERLNRDAVLLFNSGYAANQALCQALFKDGGEIVADKLMHASFLEGAMASSATLQRFRHNDTGHLARLLEREKNGDRLIVSEGVFSMDGDTAPASELAAMAVQADAWFMLDDAHGFGVLGDSGLGTAEACGLSQSQLPVLMGTFGKAVGTAGAFVAGSQVLIDYLVNFARHYIYSTALPPAQAVATLYSLKQLESPERREALHNTIATFRQLATERGIPVMPSVSAIQPVIVGSPERAVALGNALRQRGIWAVPMRYPTVPKGTDRIRITLTATHTRRDLEALCDAFVLAQESL
ncbi:8-amino-7-oxononanoate synthase [Alteromonas sp. CYL-A6]|uniref:8-amino-7-oxononanoate synthase n=1 Tax=Alteromonas nitratireducens TaxID=3390813 RepID=UPI0034AC75FD